MIITHLTGNLGKDAEMNTLESGSKVINFSVAHTEKYKGKDGEKKEKTIWVECSWWKDGESILPYLKKGQQVYVYGRPDIRIWEKDNNHGAAMTLRVIDLQLLGSKSQEAKEDNVEKKKEEAPKQTKKKITADDLPF